MCPPELEGNPQRDIGIIPVLSRLKPVTFYGYGAESRGITSRYPSKDRLPGFGWSRRRDPPGTSMTFRLVVEVFQLPGGLGAKDFQVIGLETFLLLNADNLLG